MAATGSPPTSPARSSRFDKSGQVPFIEVEENGRFLEAVRAFLADLR
jgi:hypothetical protein